MSARGKSSNSIRNSARPLRHSSISPSSFQHEVPSSVCPGVPDSEHHLQTQVIQHYHNVSKGQSQTLVTDLVSPCEDSFVAEPSCASNPSKRHMSICQIIGFEVLIQASVANKNRESPPHAMHKYAVGGLMRNQCAPQGVIFTAVQWLACYCFLPSLPSRSLLLYLVTMDNLASAQLVSLFSIQARSLPADTCIGSQTFSNFITTITNIGTSPVTLVKVPTTLFNGGLPTNIFDISHASGAIPQFSGMAVKYSLSKAAESGDFTTLAPGESINVAHDRKPGLFLGWQRC